MNTLFYNLTGMPIFEKNYVEMVEDLRVSKGLTEVTFSFKNILMHGYEVSNIEVDFNDGSPKYIRECSFNNNFNILNEDIKHRYIPNHLYDYTIFYPVVSIKFLTWYSIFTVLNIIIPIRISRPSFYSEHRNLTVNSIQFIDETNDPIFTSFQTANGDILNLKIK